MFLIAGILLLFIILSLYAITVYNQFARMLVLVKESWSGIGTFLQQRNDVIPNLVEVAQGYAGHENKTLTEVTMWRNKSASATGPAQQNQANAGLQQALIDLYQVAEQYPDLKADQHFLRLQDELSQIEEKINQSRRYYNATVRDYNQAIVVFPKNLVAGITGFKPEVFFAEDAAARKVPEVKF